MGVGYCEQGGYAPDPQGSGAGPDWSSSSKRSSGYCDWGSYSAWQYGEQAGFEESGWGFDGWGQQRPEQRLPHPNVPKPKDFSQKRLEPKQPPVEKPVTTLMLRNVPNRCTRNGLQRELERLGLKDLFDFLYLPIDQSTQRSVGYAFVNFVGHESAALAAQVLTDCRFPQFPRTKPMQVAPAHLQGLEENLRHYSNTAVLGAAVDAHRPLVLPQPVAPECPVAAPPAPVIDKGLKLPAVSPVLTQGSQRQRRMENEVFCAMAA